MKCKPRATEALCLLIHLSNATGLLIHLSNVSVDPEITLGGSRTYLKGFGRAEHHDSAGLNGTLHHESLELSRALNGTSHQDSAGLNGSSERVTQPSPRLPPECESCAEKQGKTLSCSGMKAACKCCQGILSERKRMMCRVFEKSLGPPYTKNNGTDCINTIHMAMDQRDTTCDVAHDRQVPLTGLAPKRFNDMCDGTRSVGCGSQMCGSYGCNMELERVEEEYRVIEQHKKDFDDHPCRYADERLSPEQKPVRKLAEKVELERAQKEKDAAEAKVKEKAEAEAAAAKKVTTAITAHEHASEKRAQADTIVQQKVAEEKAAEAALEYARAERYAAEKDFRQKASMEFEAAGKVAQAKKAHEQASAEKADAEKALKEKAHAENEAERQLKQKKSDEKRFNDAEEEAREQKKLDDAMAEEEYGWEVLTHRRRRSYDLMHRQSPNAQTKS